MRSVCLLHSRFGSAVHVTQGNVVTARLKTYQTDLPIGKKTLYSFRCGRTIAIWPSLRVPGGYLFIDHVCVGNRLTWLRSTSSY